MTSHTYSIRLTANLSALIDSGDPGLSFSCLTILLASLVIEIIAIFCENSPILRKFDLFWPLVTSNLTWSKNDLSIFCRTCHGLSNAVYRLSLSLLVFEFSGGRSSPRPCAGEDISLKFCTRIHQPLPCNISTFIIWQFWFRWENFWKGRKCLKFWNFF